MSRYFSISIGGLPSDSDVSVYVDSFIEIKEMLDAFSEEIPHKFVSYKTQLIMNKSPEKFPHWGKVYMVKATLENGEEVPVGYCNFEKTFMNSISVYYVALVMLFVLSIIMVIRLLYMHDYDMVLWPGITAVLSVIIALNKHATTRIKLLYLMK